jgi:hypothetical protein
MTVRYDQNGITIHEADALQVATTYPANHFTLAILDGPYAMNKAEWDRLKVDDLPRWYRPHLEAADRILAPSASLYLWNTAEGWATLHPLMVSMGWAFQGLIVWEKGPGREDKGYQTMRGWPCRTEVCGFYHRVGIVQDCARVSSDIGDSAAARAVGCDPRLPALWRGWPGVHGSCWPSRGQWLKYAAAAGRSDGEQIWRQRGPPAFNCPAAVGNVWSHGHVKGAERIRSLDGSALHPCQKPILFADRMIRASTRPGERVWVPFGGTCREAIAADRIRRSGPADAREVVTCELNQDGPDYLDPVVRILNGEGSRPADPRQVALL